MRVDGKRFINRTRYSQLLEEKNIIGLSGVTELNRPTGTTVLTELLFCEVFDEMYGCMLLY
jgi:hypothetical protein